MSTKAKLVAITAGCLATLGICALVRSSPAQSGAAGDPPQVFLTTDRAPRRGTVVVAAENIAKQTTITSKMITVGSRFVPEGALFNPSDCLGRRTKVSIDRGIAVTEAALYPRAKGAAIKSATATKTTKGK